MTRLAHMTAALAVTAFAVALPATAAAQSDPGSPPPEPTGPPPSETSGQPPTEPRDSPSAPLECTIVGTDGADVIVGTRKRDVICALSGDDVIRGRRGNDKIYPGPGRDRIEAGSGDDRILAADGQKDSIFGGRGREVASLDPNDRAEGVEVRRGLTAGAATVWNGAGLGPGGYRLGRTSCDLGVENWASGGNQRGYTDVESPDAKGFDYTSGEDPTRVWFVTRWFKWDGGWTLVDWSDWHWGDGSDLRSPAAWHNARTQGVITATQVGRSYFDPGYYAVAQEIYWVAYGRVVKHVYQWTPHSSGVGYCAL